MPDTPAQTMRPPSRWPHPAVLAWVLATTGLVLLAAACVLGLTGWTGGQKLPSVGVVPQAQPVLRASPGVTPAPSVPPWDSPPPATPTRLRLPSLGVDAPVVPVTVLLSGGLAVPDNPHVLGWWHDGARPGSQAGTVVIDGHVDTRYDGPGALFRLSRARPGQPIILETNLGPRRYVLTALRSYPKADLPAEVFATAGRPRLILITCGGAFDSSTRQYADNVVAYAIPDLIHSESTESSEPLPITQPSTRGPWGPPRR